MQARSMNGTRASRRLLPAIIILFAVVNACATSRAGSPAPPTAEAHPIRASDSFNEGASIESVLAERGIACIRTANISRRRPSDADLEALAEAVAPIDAAGGWLKPDLDPLAPGQVFVGPLEAAAAAFGGEIVGPPEDQWILMVNEGRPLAVKLSAIVLANGRIAWVLAGRIAGVECVPGRS